MQKPLGTYPKVILYGHAIIYIMVWVRLATALWTISIYYRQQCRRRSRFHCCRTHPSGKLMLSLWKIVSACNKFAQWFCNCRCSSVICWRGGGVVVWPTTLRHRPWWNSVLNHWYVVKFRPKLLYWFFVVQCQPGADGTLVIDSRGSFNTIF
jgi:hypothetical protein